MTTKTQLVERWKSEPGLSVKQAVYDALRAMWNRGGGSATELRHLLVELPHYREVANGLDFRGMEFSGCRCVDLKQCDFTYAKVGLFPDRDLSGSRFDFAEIEGGFGQRINGCTFVGATLRSVKLMV